MICKATRIQNDSKTLIDHILSNSRELGICAGTIPSDISDHFFTFAMPSFSPVSKQTHRIISSRDFSYNNLLGFKRELGITNWDHVYTKDNVDEAYDEFWNTYNVLYEQKFPLRKKRFNKNVHKLQGFMTHGLLTSRNSKIALHKASIANPTAENVNKFKTFRTIYQRVLRAAKKLYFTSKLRENANNPKKTWETLNEILGKSKKSESVEKISVNGITTSDPCEIANRFNSFFVSVGQQISNSVPPIAKSPEDYVNYEREIPEMLMQNTTPEHVKKVIRQLKAKQSSDANGVSSKMIRFIGDVIANPLSHIFNISLNNGVFPSKLKLCRVIPIFKAGNSLECDNYRPISLLSSISKILEKIVAKKLITHLLSND
jgi:hypothetical protein